MSLSNEYFTPSEVAALLKVSPDTVIRRFEHCPGVIDLGTEETRFKRRHRVLRIPREALEKYVINSRVQ